MSERFQRDAFFDRVYELALEDRNIIIVVADMSAPALDKFRITLPNQFINVGIAEQNAIQIASGLALEGKKVIVYAIAPFITLRALEQIRVSSGIMGIPITIVGMGTGLSYESDGPTHHLIEDVSSIMRVIPNIDIFNVTDSVMAAKVADIACNPRTTTYIRIDKDKYEDIYDFDLDLCLGMGKILDGDDYVLLSTGVITHTAIKVARRINTPFTVIDVYKIPINSRMLIDQITGNKRIFTLEEHFLPGGFGSAVCEILVDNNIHIPVTRIGIDITNGYKFNYKYGGRNIIRKHLGLDEDSIYNKIIKEM